MIFAVTRFLFLLFSFFSLSPFFPVSKASEKRLEIRGRDRFFAVYPRIYYLLAEEIRAGGEILSGEGRGESRFNESPSDPKAINSSIKYPSMPGISFINFFPDIGHR